jgi:hypothetical protein
MFAIAAAAKAANDYDCLSTSQLYMKNSLSNERDLEIWKGVRLIGSWRWILSRGLSLGCFVFTLSVAYDVFLTFKGSNILPNWKVTGGLLVWLPAGIAWAAFFWRRKEHAFLNRAVGEQSGGTKT